MHVLDLAPFANSDTNITGFRMVDPSRYDVDIVVKDWMAKERMHGKTYDITPHTLKVSTSSVR